MEPDSFLLESIVQPYDADDACHREDDDAVVTELDADMERE